MVRKPRFLADLGPGNTEGYEHLLKVLNQHNSPPPQRRAIMNTAMHLTITVSISLPGMALYLWWRTIRRKRR